MVLVDAGIKFIPLRTPGGELIPGSGLFVQIKKMVLSVPEPKRDIRETTQDQQICGKEIAVVDIEDKSYCTDEDTALTEDSFELEADANYCERNGQQLRPTRRRFSTPASLTYATNSHFKGSVQLNIIAEVNDDTEELRTSDSPNAA